MYIRHDIGKKGEEYAAKYLIENNYKIVQKNFNCRQGEIDIIAKYKEELIFIEVKTRTNKNYGQPVDAITYYKKNHIIKAIEYYLYTKKLENKFIRIDVIEVYQNQQKIQIKHIKNAIEI